MTKEERELLLKDLCGRLPYGVIVHGIYANQNFDFDTESDYIEYKEFDNVLTLSDIEWIQMCAAEVKPYLYPMSSMTEEQYEKFIIISGWDGDIEDIRRGKFLCLGTIGIDYIYDTIDWFNKNHFDYRGLIEKGLAIDCSNLNIY